MEGKLVAGQWVEVSIEDLQTPILLNGFVLRLRPSGVLLTFPELLEPPEGLESEARATVRYSNAAGSFAALGHIVRVASGPPVTVTLKRLVPVDDNAHGQEGLTRIPVLLHIIASRVTPSMIPEGIRGAAQSLSDNTMLLQTSVLLAVGDTLRLLLGDPVEHTVQGRVIQVFESEGSVPSEFGVGIELVHESDDQRERWHQFIERHRQSESK